ncbi:hypothetical protein [Streptomyces sp. NPDC058657]|uniref:hypothetical protein n=1 Tax=unclassified Streptomyces TaxID=2593676 RepID=UPI003663C616
MTCLNSRRLTDEQANRRCPFRPMPGAVDVVARFAARVPVAVAGNVPCVLLDTSLAHGGLVRRMHW